MSIPYSFIGPATTTGSGGELIGISEEGAEALREAIGLAAADLDDKFDNIDVKSINGEAITPDAASAFVFHFDVSPATKTIEDVGGGGTGTVGSVR
jgi:hypothetical protein